MINTGHHSIKDIKSIFTNQLVKIGDLYATYHSYAILYYEVINISGDQIKFKMHPKENFFKIIHHEYSVTNFEGLRKYFKKL